MEKQYTIAVNDVGLLNKLVMSDCQCKDVAMVNDDVIWWYPRNKKVMKIVAEYYINLYFKKVEE